MIWIVPAVMLLLDSPLPASAAGRAIIASGGRTAAPGVGKSPQAVPKYVLGIGLSLREQNFYASHLVASLRSLIPRIDVSQPESADLLRDQILGIGAKAASPAQLVADMGRSPLPADQAAALLVTHAAAEPRSLPTTLGELDRMKPGLGTASIRKPARHGDRDSAGARLGTVLAHG